MAHAACAEAAVVTDRYSSLLTVTDRYLWLMPLALEERDAAASILRLLPSGFAGGGGACSRATAMVGERGRGE